MSSFDPQPDLNAATQKNDFQAYLRNVSDVVNKANGSLKDIVTLVGQKHPHPSPHTPIAASMPQLLGSLEIIMTQLNSLRGLTSSRVSATHGSQQLSTVALVAPKTLEFSPEWTASKELPRLAEQARELLAQYMASAREQPVYREVEDDAGAEAEAETEAEDWRSQETIASLEARVDDFNAACVELMEKAREAVKAETKLPLPDFLATEPHEAENLDDIVLLQEALRDGRGLR